jgi:AcrR family transcriptional regulator
VPRERPRKKAKGRYHHGELRRALVEATLRIVERDGTGAVSLSAAARRVGVSPQATYNHFRDKSTLLAAAGADWVRALAAALRAAGDAEKGPGARLEATGVAYVTFALEHVAVFRLLGAPELADKASHPELAAAYDEAFEVLLARIRECQAAGVVSDGDARALSIAAWATVHGAAWLLVDGELGISGATPRARDAARDVVRVLFKGLKRR